MPDGGPLHCLPLPQQLRKTSARPPPPNASRKAAKEYSPRRKPWVAGLKMSQPRRGERTDVILNRFCSKSGAIVLSIQARKTGGAPSLSLRFLQRQGGDFDHERTAGRPCPSPPSSSPSTAIQSPPHPHILKRNDGSWGLARSVAQDATRMEHRLSFLLTLGCDGDSKGPFALRHLGLSHSSFKTGA